MSVHIKITGIPRLLSAMESTPDAVSTGARKGIDDGLNLWQKAARNVALKDTGNLRSGIQPDGITGGGLDLEGTIISNAYNNGFNYAYYWHVIGKQPKHLTTPGTTGESLKKSGEESGDAIIDKMQKAVNSALRSKGW